MQTAAVRNGVPYTLLAAVAFIESRYDVYAVGTKLKTGGNARGLFQLTPGAVESLNVADPTDPAEAADAAARLIAYQIPRYDYAWEYILAAYNMGPTKVDALKKEGKPLPAEVDQYQSDVQASRRWLQRQGWEKPATQKPGQQPLDLTPTALQRLDEAINGLDQANPGWRDLAPLVATWRDWYTPAIGNKPDGLMVTEPLHVAFWVSYAKRYDRAPLTPGRIPPPEFIAPTLWQRLLADAQRILDNARIARNEVLERLRTHDGAADLTITVDDPERRDPGSILPLVAALVLLLAMSRKES